jgi:hypothetical protein
LEGLVGVEDTGDVTASVRLLGAAGVSVEHCEYASDSVKMNERNRISTPTEMPFNFSFTRFPDLDKRQCTVHSPCSTVFLDAQADSLTNKPYLMPAADSLALVYVRVTSLGQVPRQLNFQDSMASSVPKKRLRKMGALQPFEVKS